MDAFEHEALRALRDFDPGLLAPTSMPTATTRCATCVLITGVRGADPRGGFHIYGGRLRPDRYFESVSEVLSGLHLG